MSCRRAAKQIEQRRCEWCDQPFTALTCPSQQSRGRFCSRSCSSRAGWATRPEGTSYLRHASSDHPLADATGYVSEHRAVLYAKIGPGTHPCHWCQQPVQWGRGSGKGILVTDHLDGQRRNNGADNLVPSCQSCNVRRMRSNRITENDLFITRAGVKTERVRVIERTCPCGATFLVPPSITRNPKQPNAGTYCSRSCARRKWPAAAGT